MRPESIRLCLKAPTVGAQTMPVRAWRMPPFGAATNTVPSGSCSDSGWPGVPPGGGEAYSYKVVAAIVEPED